MLHHLAFAPAEENLNKFSFKFSFWMAMTTLTHLQGGKGKGKGEKANQEVGDQDGDKNLMKVKICDKNFMFCLTKSL